MPVIAAAAATARGGASVDDAVTVLAGRKFAVLTGAGVSTDSGIPDYRGEGSVPRTPMTFQAFLADPDYRKRYWVGNQLGWRRFQGLEPNDGHRALVRLEVAGLTGGVITQNVDGLHLRAGSRRVVDLHGSSDRVRCLSCGQMYARDDIAERIATANPWLDEPETVELGPDGDVATARIADFVTPVCTVCGGMLKPDVVFLGEFIPVEKFAMATALMRSSDALLIAGSSLVVNSGIRLLDRADRRGLPIVIVNRGATRGDSRATVKLDAGTSETLTALAEHLAP